MVAGACGEGVGLVSPELGRSMGEGDMLKSSGEV